MRTLSILILLTCTTACRGWNGIGNVNDSGTQTQFDALTLETPEEWGENCTFGGIRIDTGFDNGDGDESANDGILDAGEIDSTEYTCTTGPAPLVHLRFNNSLASAGSLDGVGTGAHGGYDLDACGSLVHAASFSDHAVLTPATDLQAGQASLSVWFLTTDSTGYHALIAQPDPILATGLLQMGLVDGTALFEYFAPGAGTPTLIESTVTVDDDGWHQLVTTVDAQTNELTGYLDGVAIGTLSTDSAVAYAYDGALRVGQGRDAAGSFVGRIDNVRVYDLVLSPEEVHAIYTSDLLSCGN